MSDYGHQYADKKISEVDRKLRKIYRQAQKEMKEKLSDFNKRYEVKNREMRELVRTGKIDESDYQKWLRTQVYVRQQWKDKIAQVNAILYDHNKQAVKLINEGKLDTFAENYNYQSYLAEKKLVGSFSLYNAEAVSRLMLEDPQVLPEWDIDKKKDYKWNTQKINNIVMQGIIQGEGIPEITKKLCEGLGTQDEDRMRTFARTAMTGAENAGRQQQMNDAAKMGIEVHKQWEATHDSRTRDSHRAIDGEEVPYDEEFSNGLEYPGDPDGDPAEVYNCRCTMKTIYPAYEDREAAAKRYEDMEIEGQSYEDWKKFDSYDEWKKAKEEEKKAENSARVYSVDGLVEPVRPHREDFANEADYYRAREKYMEERAEYKEKLNKTVEEAMSINRFKTKEDVMNWAKENGIEIAEDVFNKIDIRAFDETSMALDEMFKRFPETKSYAYEYFDGTMYRTHFSIGLTDDGLLAANGGLNFNPSWFRSYEEGLRQCLTQQTSGFNVRGDGTFSSFIRHEYGHNAQSYIENKIRMKYHMTADDWRIHYSKFDEYKKAQAQYSEEYSKYRQELFSLVGLKGSSEYSNTNEHELFAEGFASWASGETTEFARKFGEFFERWYY